VADRWLSTTSRAGSSDFRCAAWDRYVTSANDVPTRSRLASGNSRRYPSVYLATCRDAAPIQVHRTIRETERPLPSVQRLVFDASNSMTVLLSRVKSGAVFIDMVGTGVHRKLCNGYSLQALISHHQRQRLWRTVSDFGKRHRSTCACHVICRTVCAEFDPEHMSPTAASTTAHAASDRPIGVVSASYRLLATGGAPPVAIAGDNWPLIANPLARQIRVAIAHIGAGGIRLDPSRPTQSEKGRKQLLILFTPLVP